MIPSKCLSSARIGVLFSQTGETENTPALSLEETQSKEAVARVFHPEDLKRDRGHS